MKILRLFLIPLFIGLLASPVMAQTGPLFKDSDIVTFHSAAASAVRGTIFPVTGYNTVGVEISTITDATITFEGSIHSAWSSISCTNKATGTAATTATTAGAYVCDVAGLSSFSARISTFGSGTVTARGRAQTTALSSGASGAGGGDASLAEQQSQTALLTTIDADTGAISLGTGGTADAASTPGGTGSLSAKLRTLSGLATDPCKTGAKIFIPISQAASTQLFTGTASNRTYVCSVLLTQPSTSTQTFSLVSGTGSVCATSTGAMIGSTTAANGGSIPFSLGNGDGTVAKSDTDADNVCLLQSTTDRINGVLSYVVAPN